MPDNKLIFFVAALSVFSDAMFPELLIFPAVKNCVGVHENSAEVSSADPAATQPRRCVLPSIWAASRLARLLPHESRRGKAGRALGPLSFPRRTAQGCGVLHFRST